MNVYCYFDTDQRRIELVPVTADEHDVVAAIELEDLMGNRMVEVALANNSGAMDCDIITEHVKWYDLDTELLYEVVEEDAKDWAKRNGYTVEGFYTV